MDLAAGGDGLLEIGGLAVVVWIALVVFGVYHVVLQVDLRSGVGVGKRCIEEQAGVVEAFGAVGADFVIEEGEQAVSADGTILATGARFFNSSKGRVSVYKYKGATSGWQQRGSDLLPQNDGDQGGAAVDLSEDGRTIIVSAPRFDGSNGADSGSVGVYDW